MGHQKRPLEVPPNSPLSSTARVRLRVLGTWLLWPRSSLYRLRAPASRRRPRFASTATTTPASKHASARIANPRRAQFCLPPRSRATTPVAPVCYTGAHCAEKQRRQRDRTLLPRGAIHECDWQKRFSFPPSTRRLHRFTAHNSGRPQYPTRGGRPWAWLELSP